MARIHPDVETWPRLRRSLEDGERALALFLGEHLDETWHVFVRVWFNGAEVDVAAWSPLHGLLLYEVKDWQALGASALKRARCRPTGTGCETQSVRSTLTAPRRYRR
jgi:hypothetical protein